jgi:hypothetical protein
VIHQDFKMPRSAHIIGMLVFVWVMLDSMMTYFTRSVIGVAPPVIAALPFFLLGIMFKWGIRSVIPPRQILLALGLSLVGFAVGILLQEKPDFDRFGTVFLAVCTFFVGYFSMRWTDNDRLYTGVFTFIPLAYVLVCVIALRKIMPHLFPVINAVWSNKGVLELRPEITTDQNFQIFYLFPIVLILALPFRFWRFSVAILGIAGVLYVLAEIQTRSGFLVFAGLAVLAWLAPIWTPSLGKKKLAILPIIFLVLAVLNINTILHVGQLLIIRFTGEGGGTGTARLHSVEYLFRHLFDPTWWIPRGYDEFKSLNQGAIPHSNITAMFLEGGILGLYMWIVVFVVPLIALARMFIKKQLDKLATLVLLGGTAMLVVQLSLNVPFFKQPWLWAGAVVGTLYRSRHKLAVARQEKAEMFVKEATNKITPKVPEARFKNPKRI